MSKLSHTPKPPMWFRWAALSYGGLCTGMALTLCTAAPVAALPVAVVAAGVTALHLNVPAGRRAAK